MVSAGFSVCIYSENAIFYTQNKRGTIMPFQKGQSGNPGGRPKKGKTFTDILNENYDKETLIKAMWKKAIEEEDFPTQKYLADRWEGTPKQTISGDNEAPLANIILRTATKDDVTD